MASTAASATAELFANEFRSLLQSLETGIMNSSENAAAQQKRVTDV
jgi:hypothetical protein